MKKFLSLLLSLIMTISAFASVTITAYAAEGAYNTADKARDYTIGTTINGTFAQNDKLDFIKLTLYESGIINFICEGTTSYNLIIYQENNLDEIIESDSIQYNENLGKSYGENSYYLTSGTYYIKVITYNVNSESYTINTTFTSANESFPESIYSNNNIIGKANEISLNTLYNGILAANDETDFYKFTVTSGKHTLYIKSNYHINFSIYTLNGEKLYGDSILQNKQTKYAEDNISISLSSGTYCLKISEFDGTDLLYNFKISVPHTHKFEFSRHISANYTNKGYDEYICQCGATQKRNITNYKKLNDPVLKSVKAIKKGHKIKVSWNKVSNASGYQVCWYKDKKCKKTVAKKNINNANTTTYSGKGFAKGKKYYVRVRAYKNVNGSKIYSKKSNIKSVKAK